MGLSLTADSPDPPMLIPTVFIFFKKASLSGVSQAMKVPRSFPLRFLILSGYLEERSLRPE